MSKRKRKYQPKKLPAKELQERLKKKFYKNPSGIFNAGQIIRSEAVNNNKDSVNHALEYLTDQGFLLAVEGGRYRFNQDMVKDSRIFEGVVDMTKHGSAYIVCEELESDVYVPKNKLKGALHNDRVEVMVLSKNKNKYSGEVVKVLVRNTTRFVGRYQSGKSFGFVIPFDSLVSFDIYIHEKENMKARDGDRVIVRVDRWPSNSRKSPIGHVERILSEEDMHEVRMQTILAEQGFSEVFPSAVLNETAIIPEDLDANEIKKRRDFRDYLTMTIDPAASRDFDDALSIRELSKGQLEIGVHIADVSHFVLPDTELDKEAYKRSTSVYLVDRVAPMLPERLTNELCSLRPGEDKLTFSAVFTLDKNFDLLDFWVGKTAIRSDYRLSYKEAQAIVDGELDSPVRNEVRRLNQVAKKFRQRRMKKESIEFESDEVEIILDENNKPIDIKVLEVLDSHRMIEEFMLLANRHVGHFMAYRDKPNVPFIYRIHDLPDEDKMKDYTQLLQELGFQFYMDSPQAIKSSLHRLHMATQGNESLKMIFPMAIRMMAKAIYSTDNIGHFGLGFEDYSHFTAPIRRYSDILAHRILYQNLDRITRVNKSELEIQCRHISDQERKAMDAERDSIKYKKAEYLADRIGQVFDGQISGMIDMGVFVQIVENHCEGMVAFDRFEESYVVAESRLEAKGSLSGKVLRMGDPLRVKIVHVDIDRMEVDMDLVAEE